MLANQIDDAPAAIALLDVREGERRYLGASQAAAKENIQDGAIPPPLWGGGLGC
jgi:hypothetical protein